MVRRQLSTVTTGLLVRTLALAVVAGLAGAALLLFGAAPAQAACNCQDKTLQQNADGADAIFSGTVRETRSSNDNDKPTYTYVVDVDRVWKEDGTVVTATVRVFSARAARACGLGELPGGTDYVFFAKARATSFRASSCGGSRPATDSATSEISDVLGPGQPLVSESRPPELELVPVDTAEPRSVTRLAAPGGAIALAGILGLVGVRVARSRR